MTADEWDRATKVGRILDALGPRASRVKLRLFACACCRAIWDLLEDPRSRTAVEVAERFALGLASKAELHEAWEAACEAWQAARAAWQAAWLAGEAARAAWQEARSARAVAAAWAAGREAAGAAWEAARSAEASARAAGLSEAAGAAARAEQAELLRCIFGNPFRPVEVQPQWRTETVVRIARSIHEGRTFDLLPVLADALEEAGCTCPYTLGHCRVHRKHALGCWVVSGIIGDR
jgi:hypothetical protein